MGGACDKISAQTSFGPIIPCIERIAENAGFERASATVWAVLMTNQSIRKL